MSIIFILMIYFFAIFTKLIYLVLASDFSWTLESNFNYKSPENAILNIAYPSSIAYYYITIIPPITNYSFIGKFLKKNVFESSLTVYNSNGLINNNYDSINNYNTKNYISYDIYNYNYEVKYVIQRYYVNLDIYSETDLITNLFKVYDSTNNIYLYPLEQSKRIFLSMTLSQPLETLISSITPVSNDTFSKFYLPGQFKGLFPDKNHYYLISSPGNFKLLKVYGYFYPDEKFPYIDFITINQNNISTDNGLPFYKFLNYNYYYEIYISTADISNDYIYSIDPTANIIKWLPENNNKGLIFRMINYNNYGIPNATGPLTPEETEEKMDGYYPKIEVLDINY